MSDKKTVSQKPASAMLPRGKARSGIVGLPELEKGSPFIEFMGELSGYYNLKTFRKMRYNDPIIGGIMLEIELLFSSLAYEIEGPNADFIKECFSQMEQPIERVIADMTSAITYGFYVGEMVLAAKDGKIMLVDVEPRFQETISAIGNAKGEVKQETSSGTFYIPLSKCLHHTIIADSRNPFGISLLRHIYKPYYFKTAIEAAEASSIDRDLSGLPMLQAPQGFDFTKADPESGAFDQSVAETLEWAINLVSQVRVDNQQGIVIPYGWVFSIVRGENRSSVPTTDIINRLNSEIVSGLLAQFLFTSKQTDAQTQIASFMEAVDAMAVKLALSINSMIKKLCAFNGLPEHPKLSFRKLRREQLTNMASYVARLVSNGIITPTVELEERLLRFADLPVGTNKKELPVK